MSLPVSKNTCFFVAVWYTKFLWKGFGLKGLLNPKNLYYLLVLVGFTIQSAIGELVYKFKTRGLSHNSQISQMREEFKGYQYKPSLQSWMTEFASQSQSMKSEEQPAKDYAFK